MNTLIILLQHPLTWLIASLVCAISIGRAWKGEGSPNLFQAFWTVSLFANAGLFGVTVVTYSMTHDVTVVQSLFGG